MITATGRAVPRRSRRVRGETGAATLEYIGMIVLAAVLAAGLLLTATGTRLADRFSASICQILQVENCPTFGIGAGASVPTMTPLEQATGGRYVAMGDSYSSGEGAGSYESGTDMDDRNDLWPFNNDQESHNRCRRSMNTYSRLLKARYDFKGGSTFTACSGAVLNDLEHPDSGNTGQGPQMLALDKETSLATISVGGNDVGFAEIVTACVMNGADGLPGLAKCQDTYEPQMAGRLAELRQKLIVQYGAMKAKAPKARVVVMGYPHLFVENPSIEISNLLFDKDQIWMNAKADQLNAMLKASAEEAGVEFVDPTDAFKGHEVGSEDPWINSLDLGGPGVMASEPSSFHPNAQGQSVLATLMGDQIEKPK